MLNTRDSKIRGVWPAAVGFPFCAALLISSCGVAREEAIVADPNLTRQAALEQGFSYLERTLAALPEGAGLSLKSDNPQLAELPRETRAVPCSDRAEHTSENFPSDVRVGYWLVGVPEGKDPQYFDKVVQTWASWGWKTVEKPDERQATFIGEDNYGLSMVNAEKGTGSISVEVATPCIKPENLGDEVVPPTVVKRP